ncbi:MAG: DinB family protein [Gemmatimonadota bacterium]
MTQPPSRAERIRMYAEGPRVLQEALATVPAEAMKWRPSPAAWSAHEVIIHCADSEANAHMRLRYLLGEPEPLIVGYDQDRWAALLDYHSLPLEPALAVIAAVRANTVPLLEQITESQWLRAGRHTESGPYSAERWLEIYSEHLHQHARQLARNAAAWAER